MERWLGGRETLERADGATGVGATTASKLLARNGPRLRPIYDSVVATVIDSQDIWSPLRRTLNDLMISTPASYA